METRENKLQKETTVWVENTLTYIYGKTRRHKQMDKIRDG